MITVHVWFTPVPWSVATKVEIGRYTGQQCFERVRLFLFSLHHNDEEDSAFVPAAEPANAPVIDTIAQRYRLAKPKELGLNVHG